MRRLLDAEEGAGAAAYDGGSSQPRLQRRSLGSSTENPNKADVLLGAAEAAGNKPGADFFPRHPLFELRTGSSLHLYCSSCPCGNASLRRWAQAGKGGDASLGPRAEALPEGHWPDEPHPPMSTQALNEGQVQLLVKKDPGRGPEDSIETGNAAALTTDIPACHPDGLGDRSASVVSCGHEGVLPPGTELPGIGAGVLLTCSDKIALWSALGIQVSVS